MATERRPLNMVMSSVGGKKEFDRRYNQYKGSTTFFDTNRKELLKKYDGKWVAVYNSAVVAYGKQYKTVARKIQQRGLPIEDTVIRFITSREILGLF